MYMKWKQTHSQTQTDASSQTMVLRLQASKPLFDVCFAYFYSCRTVVEKFLLTERRATVPPLVKTVYLLRRKSGARFGLNFFIFLLCQVKIPDAKNTRHVYLVGKNINKPLLHFYKPLSAWNSPARFLFVIRYEITG